ncbi:MAG: UPF0280 family protein [Desulfobacterales bacterium]
MPYRQSIRRLENGEVVAESGPMRLFISAFVGKVPQQQMCIRAAEESFKYLERLARLKNFLSKRSPGIRTDLKDPIAIKMIRSVQAVGNQKLTPMAAVAGTIADAVAEFLYNRGMTKVVVDNGGDVAIRLKREACATVGIRPQIDAVEISNVIALDSRFFSWGVTTSGLGGRSLTQGIASAATIIARSASLADAAATDVANASYIEDPEVIRIPSEKIDPNTDIPGFDVTIKVGPLSEEKKSLAISKAIGRAELLIKKGIILGAFIVVQGKVAMTDFFRACLAK